MSDHPLPDTRDTVDDAIGMIAAALQREGHEPERIRVFILAIDADGKRWMGNASYPGDDADSASEPEGNGETA